jgi:hypothetical protein
MLMQAALSANGFGAPAQGALSSASGQSSGGSVAGRTVGAAAGESTSASGSNVVADDGDDSAQPSHADATPQLAAGNGTLPHDAVVATSGADDGGGDDGDAASDDGHPSAKVDRNDRDGDQGSQASTSASAPSIASTAAATATAATTSAAPTFAAAALTQGSPQVNTPPPAPPQVTHQAPPAPPPPPRSHVTLAVDPDVTGASRIHVSVQGAQVKATITATDGNVTVIDRQLSDLHRSLEDKGFTDVRVAVHSSDHDAGLAVSAGASGGMSDNAGTGAPTTTRSQSDGRQQQSQQRQSGSSSPEQDNASQSRHYREEPEEDAA